MATETLRILIVDDNRADARLCIEALRGDGSGAFETGTAETLKGALDALDGTFDAVLLDLGLPDSRGLETLNRLRERDASVPVIVVTGQKDEELGIEAVQSGAIDFLPKDDISPAFLTRAVRYAVERQKLRKELDRRERENARMREFASLDRISEPGQEAGQDNEPAAGTEGRPLRVAAQDEWDSLTDRYRSLLAMSVGPPALDRGPDIEAELRSLAREFARLKAGPRDVIELHVYALKSLTEQGSEDRIRALLETGRIAVLELMGYMMDVYRSVGGPPRPGG